jgi:hypothetical protein
MFLERDEASEFLFLQGKQMKEGRSKEARKEERKKATV